jgi:hypothetical protein
VNSQILEVLSGDALGDLAELLILNNRFEAEASRLDAGSIKALATIAFTVIAARDRDAFLIALDQDAPYRNANFAWLKQRRARFVYVDRIIVGTRSQGSGVATALYQHLFLLAGAAAHDRIVCEVNRQPPNLRSDRFHARLGFEEIGQALLASGKQVRYLEKRL